MPIKALSVVYFCAFLYSLSRIFFQQIISPLCFDFVFFFWNYQLFWHFFSLILSLLIILMQILCFFLGSKKTSFQFYFKLYLQYKNYSWKFEHKKLKHLVWTTKKERIYVSECYVFLFVVLLNKFSLSNKTKNGYKFQEQIVTFMISYSF